MTHSEVPARPDKKAWPSLEPTQRSDTAMRRILGQLLDALRKNIDGVLEDLDTEPLHDLRVATRRTRSALSTMKSVLPDAVVDDYASGFKWLGAVTGPCRDLDVHLIEMEDLQRRLNIVDGALDPLRHLLEQARTEEHRRVVESLCSERFRLLTDGWDEFLHTDGTDDDEPGKAGRPILDVAGKRIHKAHRRVVKRGAKLVDYTPDTSFHRLRIDAKKLRYLLEFFASLYPGETVRLLIKELKRLQDTLGSYNDMVVQRARLAALADRLTESGETNPDTIIAMGRLADGMAERQDEHRRAFADRFASFASAENRLLYQKTFT